MDHRRDTLAVARGCRRLSEGEPAVAVIEGSPHKSHQSEGGPDAAATEDSKREFQLDAATIQGANRESRLAERGLGVATNQGETLRSHQHSEGGIDVASRQARDRQVQYLMRSKPTSSQKLRRSSCRALLADRRTTLIHLT
jgi:hypothetical protein